jgi:hypothetical protein
MSKAKRQPGAPDEMRLEFTFFIPAQADAFIYHMESHGIGCNRWVSGMDRDGNPKAITVDFFVPLPEQA